jgi:hypothetical protein
MGCEVNYRSMRAVTAAEAEAIDQTAARLCENPEWVGCEGIGFYGCIDGYREGQLKGGSKFSFRLLEGEVIPGVETRIATIRDLLDSLCQISREHQVDWEIGHEYHDGPVGYIRSGVAEDKLVAEIDRLSAELEAVRKGVVPPG